MAGDRSPRSTVLWLGELRKYADADDGPAVLARLADLLDDPGHLIITTLWLEHWTTYITAARAGPGMADPAGIVGQLLKRLELLAGEGHGQAASSADHRPSLGSVGAGLGEADYRVHELEQFGGVGGSC